MRAYDVIRKKRDAILLSREDICFLVQGYSRGEIPDYQMAAFCMAVFFQGMEPDEMVWLTEEMVNSGEVWDLKEVDGPVIDKHSTGGVGDTTTLIAAPLAACCGVRIAKMSGRGLGHTGGTIDKLESIPGFRAELSEEQFIRQVNAVGLAVISQTKRLVPADGLLYALRDVTATVDSLPLIASSIMSKKLAAGASGFVLDVKVGRGAFMQRIEDARSLARAMVEIGFRFGRPTTALLTDMDGPLGSRIGNALEVREAVDVLSGSGTPALRELSMALASEMVVAAGYPPSDARKRVKAALESGAGRERLAALIRSQGGDEGAMDDFERLPTAPEQRPAKTGVSGYIQSIDPRMLGELVVMLGGGRRAKGESIDPAVGLEMYVERGQYVMRGVDLAVVHAGSADDAEQAVKTLQKAVEIGEAAPKLPSLVRERVTGNHTKP